MGRKKRELAKIRMRSEAQVLLFKGMHLIDTDYSEFGAHHSFRHELNRSTIPEQIYVNLSEEWTLLGLGNINFYRYNMHISLYWGPLQEVLWRGMFCLERFLPLGASQYILSKENLN